MTVKSDFWKDCNKYHHSDRAQFYMTTDKEFLHKQLFFFKLRRACREGGNAIKVLLFQYNKTW